MSDPTRAIVRHTPLEGQSKETCLQALATVCDTGAQCAEVQGSQLATQALTGLKSGVIKAQDSLSKKQAADLAQKAAAKTLRIDYQTRDPHSTVPSPLGKVSVVRTKPWKHSAEALLTWPKADGATGYAIEVNYTPSNPTGPWTALISGTGRRRVVKAPAPGAQLLARVAALGSGGTQSDWSDQVLVTTAS